MGKTPKAVTSKISCMLTRVFVLVCLWLVQTNICALVLVSGNSFYSNVLVLTSNIVIYLITYIHLCIWIVYVRLYTLSLSIYIPVQAIQLPQRFTHLYMHGDS